MADFSELEEAFFRAGELLSELPADAILAGEPAPEPPVGWWRRFFRKDTEGWMLSLEVVGSPTALFEVPAEIATYYASFELLPGTAYAERYDLFDTEDYELYAMAA